MALEMDRRTFLKTTMLGLTGLTIGTHLSPWRDARSSDVTIWINIAIDNQTTIVVVRAEMGQGISTALPMIVADELEADWQEIKIKLMPEIDPYYLAGMGMTTGSQSILTYFEPLRKVAAAAKEMLITACAQRWHVKPESLRAENGYVIHPIRGSMSYGRLAAEASKLPIPEDPKLKDPTDFKIIGKSLPRLDSPDHIEGKSIFGIDVKLPDMVYAAVRQSPVFGGTVANFGSLTVEGTNAEAIVEIPGGVAVVARSWWEAEKVAKSLEIEFDNSEGMEGLNSEVISEQLTQNLTKAGTQVKLVGDPLSAMESASIKVISTYEVPFLAHATMEPMACTVQVSDTSCKIWVPTQAPSLVQGDDASAIGLEPSSVSVYPTYIGGAFGRKAETDYAVQAALIAKAVGKPVKLIWSREEDIQHDYYRPVFKAELSGGIDDANSLISLMVKTAGPAIFEWGKYDMMAVLGLTMDFPYELPNMSVHYVRSDFGIPVGFWRSIGLSQNTFFVESFLDELADASGQDPIALRKSLLLNNPRCIAVLERVAEMANWGQPSVPGTGQGIAFVEHAESYLALIAEVSVESGGKVKVHKVYCAIDCGTVVNPDIVKAQMEGAMIYGLTAVLQGEITIENGRVQQSNFHDYPVLSLKDAPPVETEIILSGAAPGGVGESGTPAIIPAVTNAIFAATGHRIRKLPISKYNFTEIREKVDKMLA